MKPYHLPNKIDFEKHIDGKKSHLIILQNRRGMKVAVSDYGARIVSILVPDSHGEIVDVVLGFNTIDGYLSAIEPYYGVTIGRFANRLANGRFKLDDQEFHVQPNNGPNTLHGGEKGFHNRVWDRRVNDVQNAEFYLVSPDGEGGFPGCLTVVVNYSLTDKNELIIKYRVQTDKQTILNLTNHSFFNLNGEGNGSILNHELQINADYFLPLDEYQIPTGEFQAVAGTPFDFREMKTIRENIALPDQQLEATKGFDHNFVLKISTMNTAAAKVFSPLTGIQLEVFTTEPGVQFYTGNFLKGTDKGKKGKPYQEQSAFCLETQKFPDSPNQPDFPSCIIQPGEIYSSETRYRFSVRK